MTTFANASNITLTGQVPEWIELLPAGPVIIGQDGRSWMLPDPQTVVDSFNKRSSALVVDWEHASETRANQGLDAPAAGWIDSILVRDGAIWGRVTWTEKAAAQIAAHEYRYLSPVFTFEKTSSRIIGLVSIGLTNQPNLQLTALNREDFCSMSLPNEFKEIYTSLGLPTDSNCNTILLSIRALNDELTAARNRADQPALERFVPRADYDAAITRASNAEKRLNTIDAERRSATIQTLLDRAMIERKIAPATADYYRAMCQTEDGIAQFEAFLTKAPALIGTESGLNTVPVPIGTPEAEFAANAGLRAEFGDLDTYLAYRVAAETGRATILGSKAL